MEKEDAKKKVLNDNSHEVIGFEYEIIDEFINQLYDNGYEIVKKPHSHTIETLDIGAKSKFMEEWKKLTGQAIPYTTNELLYRLPELIDKHKEDKEE